ncbi:MAG: DUF4268 domain-containing protein [Pseudomonadota bacterium]
MTESELKVGRLESVRLREVWANEASDFTPWLASAENMALLSEALGLSLEVEDTEVTVGAFYADILAWDRLTDRKVVIENQLTPTDHSHLGQTITYASGLGAQIVIWICEDVREEHRQAIDWLNEATGEDFAFFVLAARVYRIGDSDPAPLFEIAARPNGWAKEIASRSRSVAAELSPTQKTWVGYWREFIETKGALLEGLSEKKPYKGNWQTVQTITRGGAGFQFNATFPREGMRAELYIGGADAHLAFDAINAQLDEERLRKVPDLQSMKMGQSARFYFERAAETPNHLDASEQYDWLSERLAILVKELKPLAIKWQSFADALVEGEKE